MTLSFSEKWPSRMGRWAGQPTNFVDQIWEHFWVNEGQKWGDLNFDRSLDECKAKFGHMPPESGGRQKLNTIRKGNRWKVGDKIHMVINEGAENEFQFAPVLEVKSVQKIEIDWDASRRIDCEGLSVDEGATHKFINEGQWGSDSECDLMILIDNKRYPVRQWIELATNDGFCSLEQFFTWFSDDFEGQIISWVDGVEY